MQIPIGVHSPSISVCDSEVSAANYKSESEYDSSSSCSSIDSCSSCSSIDSSELQGLIESEGNLHLSTE